MAAETQVTICNQFGVAQHVIEPTINSVAWRLNNQSMAKFAMSMNDDKCTPDNLKFGNRIVVEWDNGLPDWGGVIDTPRRRGSGEIAFTAYSGERLLDFRITGKNTSITDDPGTIAQTLLENANAVWDTTVSVGTIYDGGTSRTLDYHYHDLLQRLVDLARLTGEDFAVLPTFSSGVLTFALWWYESRGTDYSDSVWLIEDKNISAKAYLDEQGPIHNKIVLVGEGTTWGDERMDSVATDTASRTAYDYREYSEVQNVTVQGTLDANAAALLAEHKDPKNIPSLTVTDTAPALFTDYHVGDTAHVEMFLDHSHWYYAEDVRVLFREWYPDDTCRLEVQEA